MRVSSDQVLDPERLEAERARLAPVVYAMEYGADFASGATQGRWFTENE